MSSSREIRFSYKKIRKMAQILFECIESFTNYDCQEVKWKTVRDTLNYAIMVFRWEIRSARGWRKLAKMFAVSLFIWTMIRSRDRPEIEVENRRDSRRYSTYRDNRKYVDSRRNSRDTTTIDLAIVDRRRHRLRRHSRRYFVDRNKRWVQTILRINRCYWRIKNIKYNKNVIISSLRREY